VKTRNYDVALGIVFFGALIGLGIITIVLSDFALGVERYEVDFYAADVGFLRPGDRILLHGISAGKVETIRRLDQPVFTPLPHDLSGESPGEIRCTVVIRAKLDADLFSFLKEDYHILIEDHGLLGGKHIRIEVGLEDEFVSRDTVLLADAPPSVIQAAGQIIEENRAAVQNAIQQISEFAENANRADGTLGLLLNDSETRTQITEIIDNLTKLVNDIMDGEGTLGGLVTDSAPFDDLKVAMADARSAMERIRRGEGSIGKFIQEDALYDDVNELIADAKDGMAGVWEGEGTLGKLIIDEELYNQVNEFVEGLEVITEGEGMIAQLLNDGELYDKFVAMVDDAQLTFRDLREGDGLVAALINDEDMLDNFRSILNQVLGAIEDARETTPVTSLGSFLFGTF
jgi:phospholipid/cholesterol/gamma-HCH transport system substrate-binding protein